MEWKAATIEEVKAVVRRDLGKCDIEQRAAFVTYGVEPFLAPILRYGKPEYVVAVARNADEVIYWEDVEEGFNLSPLSPDGSVVEHWCNQDSLAVALNAWVEGRTSTPRFSPAISLEKTKEDEPDNCKQCGHPFAPHIIVAYGVNDFSKSGEMRCPIEGCSCFSTLDFNLKEE